MMALGFQSLVWLSGSLYVAMVVHFAYDAIAGISGGRLAEELGYPLEPLPPAGRRIGALSADGDAGPCPIPT
jgi:hypothetical protein